MKLIVGLYAITPFFVGTFAVILQTFLMILYTWFPREYKPRSGFSKWCFDSFKTIYFFFGVALLDGGIAWVGGHFGYADWRFQITVNILNLVLGFQYVVNFIVKPTKLDLAFAIAFGLAGVVMNNFVVILLSNILYRGDQLKYLYTVIAICLVVSGIRATVLWYSRKKRGKLVGGKEKKARYLWDISKIFSKIFNRKVNLVLWILVVLEIMLRLHGYSILVWK